MILKMFFVRMIDMTVLLWQRIVLFHFVINGLSFTLILKDEKVIHETTYTLPILAMIIGFAL